MKYTIINIGEENNKKKLYVLSKYKALVGYTGDNKDIMKFKDYSKAVQEMTEYSCNYGNSSEMFVVPVKLLPYIYPESNVTENETDYEARFTDAATKADKYYITATVYDNDGNPLLYIFSWDNNNDFYYWAIVNDKDDITENCLALYKNDIEKYIDIARMVLHRICRSGDAAHLEIYKVDDFINKLSKKENVQYYIIFIIDATFDKYVYLLASRGNIYYYSRFTTDISNNCVRFETIKGAKEFINRMGETLERMADKIASKYDARDIDIMACSFTEILKYKEGK